MLKQSPELTFKGNIQQARHNWLRLTPAYSVKLVSQILAENSQAQRILDPFSGTGTTGLVALQRGLEAGLVDINPFLLWLAKVKTANYAKEIISQTRTASNQILDEAAAMIGASNLWIPPISNIGRWWSSSRLDVLAKIFHQLNQHLPDSSLTKDLLLLNFCWLVMEWSNAAFNHQSMSFTDTPIIETEEKSAIYQSFRENLEKILLAAQQSLSQKLSLYEVDSRLLDIDTEQFDCVISSPPYSNRMSYIRELRPYMYWLGFLQEARQAGELDWLAIGGTWGIATSRLKNWQAENQFQSNQLPQIVSSIAGESQILANYVHKYMEDMYIHFSNLLNHLSPHARIFYIVGNSKFYETLVPVQDIYAEMLKQLDFKNIEIKAIRKRNSKKELYEYLVSATKSA